jgi:hypothetical protein
MRMAAYAALSGRGHGGLSSDGFFLAVHSARVGSGAAEPRLDEPHPIIQHSCLPAEPASGSPREVIVAAPTANGEDPVCCRRSCRCLRACSNSRSRAAWISAGRPASGQDRAGGVILNPDESELGAASFEPVITVMTAGIGERHHAEAWAGRSAGALLTRPALLRRSQFRSRQEAPSLAADGGSFLGFPARWKSLKPGYLPRARL